MESYLVRQLWRFLNKNSKSSLELPQAQIPYWELTMVLKGSLTYIINNVSYHLEANDVILVPAFSIRERPGGFTAHYLSFNFTVYDNALLPTDILYKDAITSQIKNVFPLFTQKYILDRDQTPSLSSNYPRAKMTNILNFLLFELMEEIAFNTKSPHVKNILHFIEDNLLSPISLEDISNHLHLSKEYTASIFKKEMKKTVMDFVNERKMLYAKELLQTVNISVSELSEMLGFESYGYFSRVFKKYYAISPSKYKALLKQIR